MQLVAVFIYKPEENYVFIGSRHLHLRLPADVLVFKVLWLNLVSFWSLLIEMLNTLKEKFDIFKNVLFFFLDEI